MGKKVKRVKYQLDPKGIKELSFNEIKAILRGADELIFRGGRNLLAKILKGSKDKVILTRGLDQSPVYGYYKDLTIDQITARIDWMIINDYLKIEYDYCLPLLVYSEKGWEIERDTFSDELLEKLRQLLKTGDYSLVQELKDRNRSMIFLLLEKIRATNDPSFIPLLEAWKQIDYKKVQKRINSVIQSLEKR